MVDVMSVVERRGSHLHFLAGLYTNIYKISPCNCVCISHIPIVEMYYDPLYAGVGVHFVVSTDMQKCMIVHLTTRKQARSH